MKTTFKAYLLESDRSHAITLPEAVEFAARHCSDAFYSKPIFRGTKREGALAQLVNPMAGSEPRVSSTGVNLTNLIMSHSSNWESFPRRNRSIIASLGKTVAREYGPNVYRVYPVNGAKLGVCPTQDLWVSFNRGQFEAGVYLGDNETFDQVVRDSAIVILEHGQDKSLLKDHEFAAFNYEELKAFLSKVDGMLNDMLNEKSSDEVIEELYENWSNENKEDHKNFLRFVIHKGSYMDAIESLLDPKVNRFKNVEIGALNNTPYLDAQAEIWVDKTCLLIATELNDEFDRLLDIRLNSSPAR